MCECVFRNVCVSACRCLSVCESMYVCVCLNAYRCLSVCVSACRCLCVCVCVHSPPCWVEGGLHVAVAGPVSSHSVFSSQKSAEPWSRCCQWHCGQHHSTSGTAPPHDPHGG